MAPQRRFVLPLAASALALAVAGGATVVVRRSDLNETSRPKGPAVAPEAAVLQRLGDSIPGAPPAPVGANAVRFEQVSGLAATGGTLVAVGERLSRERDPQPIVPEPLAWWSDDGGATWHGAPAVGPGFLAAVVVSDGLFVAAGSRATARGPEALVLKSGDGQAWETMPLDGQGVQLQAAVATPGGPVLAGSRVDVEGVAPVAFVPTGKGAWREVNLLGESGGFEGEVRGACGSGKDVALVGKVHDRNGKGRALVLRSKDGGEHWRSMPVTSAILNGTDARANACVVVRGRLAVVGTITLHDYDRGFVTVEKDGAFPESDVLEATRLETRAHTAARGVAAVDGDLVVFGHDTSNDSSGDLAAWRVPGNGGGEAVRLTRLETLGAGNGAGEGRVAVLHDGVLVIGGTSADRAVVWRSSPAEALAAPAAAVPSADDRWWERYGRVDACALLTDAEVTGVFHGIVVKPRLSAVHDMPRVSCSWTNAEGNVGLAVELAPPGRLEVVRSSYPAELPPRTEAPGACADTWYYPGFGAVAGRCGDSAVLVGGVPAEDATRLLRAVASRLRPAR